MSISLVPSMRTKRLRDCEPGELIRYDGGDSLALAIVFLEKDQRFLATLIDPRAAPTPRFWGYDQDATVLSLGNDYRIVVDTGSASFGSMPRQAWSGAIVAQADRQYLAVWPAPQTGYYGCIAIDLASGTRVALENDCDVAVFTRWALHLDDMPRAAGQGSPLYSYVGGKADS